MEVGGRESGNSFGFPFQDALFEAQQMQKFVDKIAPDAGVEVQPLVVFINSAGSFEAEDPLFPVLYADPKKKPSLKNYLRDQKDTGRATLTDEDLDKPTPEGAPEFLSNYRQVFELAVWHEGIHVGQLTVARRALGFKPLVDAP